MLLKGIILKCCSQINGNRTIQSIYHILTGKKSIQTVQDIHLFNLDKMYGIYKTLTVDDFKQLIIQLSNQNYILLNGHEQEFTITNKGMEWLKRHKSVLDFATFNGLKYHSIDLMLFERLLLLIQVLSNRQMNHSSYIPVIDKTPIINWVKQIYKKINAKVLYTELHLLLSELSEQEAELFVNRLTGYKHYGMSIQQLARNYQINVFDIHIIFVKILHQMLDKIIDRYDEFPVMNMIISDLSKNGFITNSAHKTYQFIKKGYSIDQITRIRNLKKNTILDHIVEITLYDKHFPIDKFISTEEQLEIIRVVQETKSTKLKVIKSHLNENISYFKIRLTLAVATTRLGDLFDQ